MKLFGMELFNFKKEPEFMYDFAQHGLLNGPIGVATFLDIPPGSEKKGKKKKVEEKPKLSPKQIFTASSLNNNYFVIRVDEQYLDEQIEMLTEKLQFMGKAKKVKKTRWNEVMSNDEFEIGGVIYGRKELESVIDRLNNRRKLKDFKTVVDKYPHTTSELIGKVKDENTHLGYQRAESFVPDFPREAMDAMKEYTQMCLNLCNKKPIFYVLADNKDFQERNKRRDPILLAQSPFGHFWQILGAWDEEMIFLGDL